MTRSVVVLAGGLGTRVAHLTDADVPKAMLPVCGRPFVDVKLAELVAAGAEEIVMLVGHGAEKLRVHVGSEVEGGVPVRFVEDGPTLLGTGGAIRHALDLLPDPFWTTYGDTLLSVPLEAAEDQLARTPTLSGVMTVLRNQDRWETSNVSIDEHMLVTAYDKGVLSGSHEYIDYGMLLLRHEPFAQRAPGTAFDLGEVLREAVVSRRLGAFVVHERFHSIGTEAAWQETEEWARASGLCARLQRRMENRAGTRGLRRS
jgi:NDP-sugar pyrophosphorylase family protein